MDDGNRVAWARALTTAGWLVLFAYLLLLIGQIRRALAVRVGSFEDGVWGQRIELVSFVTLPQNLVILVPAAAAGVAAMLLLREMPRRAAASWAPQLVRIVAGVCYVVVALAVLGIIDVLAQTPDSVGGTSAILNRVGGILMAIAMIRVCLEAERSSDRLRALTQMPSSPSRVVAPAEQLVADDVAEDLHRSRLERVADDDGLALVDDEVVDDAGVVGGAGAAPAARLDLERHPLVGDLEHALRALEQSAAEVGDQTEGVDVDLHVVDDAGELIALVGCVELDLVADDVVQRPVLDGEGVDVEVGFDLDRRSSDAEPAGDLHAVAVEPGEQQSVEMARGEVVVDLERQGALAGAHRAEAEPQCRHAEP